MLETELLDHIEKTNHSEDFRNLDMIEYRRWLENNILVEDRTIGPYEAPWLKNVRSFGIETRVRHE